MKCVICTALGTQCVLFQDTHSLDQFFFKAINIWKLCTILAIEIKSLFDLMGNIPIAFFCCAMEFGFLFDRFFS